MTPFVDGLEFQPTAGAPIKPGSVHGTLLVAFDDWLVAGGTAMVAFIDRFHEDRIPVPA